METIKSIRVEMHGESDANCAPVIAAMENAIFAACAQNPGTMALYGEAWGSRINDRTLTPEQEQAESLIESVAQDAFDQATADWHRSPSIHYYIWPVD